MGKEQRSFLFGKFFIILGFDVFFQVSILTIFEKHV